MKKLCRSLEIDCIIVGSLVAESRQRFLTWAQRGQCYFSQREKRCTAWPLAWWTHEDILEYHRSFNLPYSPIYDKGHSRNGCWPCQMDIRFPDNKLKALRKSHPKLWRFLIVDKGLGVRIIALKRALSGDGQLQLSESLQKHVERLSEEQLNYFEESKSSALIVLHPFFPDFGRTAHFELRSLEDSLSPTLGGCWSPCLRYSRFAPIAVRNGLAHSLYYT